MSEDLIIVHLFAEDYPAPLSWRLAQWCRRFGADEWTITCLSGAGEEDTEIKWFDAVMQPYRCDNAARRQLSARRSDELVRSTELWQLSSGALAALGEFLAEGLFTNRSGRGGWVENPIFYRKGELMLGVVSHEAEGILRITAAERMELQNEGFPFRETGAYVGF